MGLTDSLLSELQYEAATTRKMLERVPEEHFDWKPHEKSMTMKALATHVAEMMGWMRPTLTQPELDFAKGYEQPTVNSVADLLALHDAKVTESVETLKNTSEDSLFQNWTLRNGEQIYFEMMRIQVIRGMIFNHIVHHRGQLSVYLRLKDVPIPAIYGPSADEGQM